MDASMVFLNEIAKIAAMSEAELALRARFAAFNAEQDKLWAAARRQAQAEYEAVRTAHEAASRSGYKTSPFESTSGARGSGRVPSGMSPWVKAGLIGLPAAGAVAGGAYLAHRLLKKRKAE